MKAATIRKWGDPGVFQLEDIDEPIPQPNQIKIKVFASGINPVDWKHRYGTHRLILGSSFPIVLGYDVCGEVVEIGNEVSSFKPGDIVFGDLDVKYGGGLAQYAIGSEQSFALKPENTSNEEAGAVSLAALTALQALRNKGRLTAGQTVIVNGASGGVGHLAIQIAKILGAKVIAVSSEKSKSFVESFKPDRYIDYTKEDILKSGIKADIFFDVAGNQSFLKTIHLLTKGGVYVSTLPRVKILIHKLTQPFTSNKKVKTLLRKHNAEDMKLLSEWMKTRKLNVSVDQVFPLDKVREAHTAAEAGKISGKIVVSINH